MFNAIAGLCLLGSSLSIIWILQHASYTVPWHIRAAALIMVFKYFFEMVHVIDYQIEWTYAALQAGAMFFWVSVAVQRNRLARWGRVRY